jgi:hypothetical protein
MWDLLKEGVYLDNFGSLRFSSVPVEFAHFSFEHLDKKELVRQNCSMIRGKIREMSNLSPDVFCCYWFIQDDGSKYKITVCVKSENVDVNRYLSSLLNLVLDKEKCHDGND